MGQNIYMLPSNMNLKIKTGTVRYNNKILISDGKFSLGKNKNVNALVLEKPVIFMPKMKSHKTNPLVLAKVLTTEKPNISHKQEPTHNEEKIALVLFLAGGFAIWNMFR